MMNKTLKISINICFVLLIITGILSVFNIGSQIQPAYTYVPSDLINYVVIISGILAFVMSFMVIFSCLSKKENSIYTVSILILSTKSLMDIVLGGNLLFFIAGLISIIVFTAWNIYLKKKASI